jgi:hypothetical protein
MADEEQIVNELLKQPVEKPAVPEKPQKRKQKGIETRKANKIKRAEKERVLKDSGVDEKISKLYQEKLEKLEKMELYQEKFDKMELLSQKFEEMLSAQMNSLFKVLS